METWNEMECPHILLPRENINFRYYNAQSDYEVVNANLVFFINIIIITILCSLFIISISD